MIQTRFEPGIFKMRGTALAKWLRCRVTNREVAGPIPDVSGFFINIKSFRSHYGPGVDTASNRNEYREYFLGGKGGRYLKLTTLPPSCAFVTKSENLNFLEHSGPFQACNGTELPLPLPIFKMQVDKSINIVEIYTKIKIFSKHRRF